MVFCYFSMALWPSQDWKARISILKKSQARILQSCNCTAIPTKKEKQLMESLLLSLMPSPSLLPWTVFACLLVAPPQEGILGKMGEVSAPTPWGSSVLLPLLIQRNGVRPCLLSPSLQVPASAALGWVKRRKPLQSWAVPMVGG